MTDLGEGAKDELHIVKAETKNYEQSQITGSFPNTKVAVHSVFSLSFDRILPAIFRFTSFARCRSEQHLVAVEEKAETAE